MKNCILKNLFYLLSGILCVLNSCIPINSETQIVALRCEYLTEPLGIDEPAPRFTWEYESEQVDFMQKYYRIRVASSPDALAENLPDIWDSGKVKSDRARAVYEGKPLSAHTRYYWDVQVWDQKGRLCKPETVTYFETAKMIGEDWNASWITDQFDKEYRPAPIFRTTIELKKMLRSARIYISGLGYYELFINGARIGRNRLDPAYTHFDKRILYNTYDVTENLTTGKNAIAVMLGNGWFNEQSVAVWDFHKAAWRKRPQLICELRLTFTDGSTETIGTDNRWKTRTGAVVFNNIYSGDYVDAREEEPGWQQPDFDDTAWPSARTTSAPASIMRSQLMPGIEVVKEIVPVSVRSFGDKIWVYDLGQNISGGSCLRVKGPAGTRITLKHGEMLKENGRLEQGNIDIYFHPVDPEESFQTDVFILRGDSAVEVFYPRFNYHGFQYVEVESSQPIEMTQESLTGWFMHTRVEPVGSFRCSNDLLNQIWAATNRSYLGNLHGIPTDCPQREKNGWTADAHAAMDLALLNFDGIKLYEKWMNDFLDNQRPEGDISGIVPSAGWGYGTGIGPVWDAAMFIVPHSLYMYYGDTLTIGRMYDACKRYLDYLKTKETEEGLLNYGLGDWLTYRAQTPNDFTSSCFYYWDYKLMAEFATVLGHDASLYQAKADTLKSAICRKYFHESAASFANGTQTALGTALYMGLVPKGSEQRVADRLAEAVRATDGHLDFGLLGSKFVPTVLTRYGYADLAYAMIAKETVPSWGAWIRKGATTLAETWMLSPRFNDASLNHVFMGDVSAWMYQRLAGINYDEKSPGFKNIVLRPQFVGELDWVEASYRSVSGLIDVVWKRTTDNTILYSVKIPANTTADLYLSNDNVNVSPACKYVKKEGCFRLKSGAYTFEIGK